MGFDFGGFLKDINFKPVEHFAASVGGEILTDAQRLRGAVTGSLVHAPTFTDIFTDPQKYAKDYASQFSGGLEGFKNPNKYETTDIGLFSKTPDKFKPAVNLVGDVALDPLTYAVGAGLVGKGKFIGPVSDALLGSGLGPEASAGRKIAMSAAQNLGGRVGAEGGKKLFEGTPLETPASIIGGIVGGVGASQGIHGILGEPAHVSKPVYKSMVEEQLHEGDIHSYLDSLDRTPVVTNHFGEPVTPGSTGVSPDKFDAFVKENKDSLRFKITSPYDEAIAELYRPDTPVDVNIVDHTGIAYNERNVKVIPLDHAITDPVLKQAHIDHTTRFYENDFNHGANPEVQDMLSNWITTIGGKPAQVMRRNFEEGSQAAYDLRNSPSMQAFRDTINSAPDSQLIQTINGRKYALLYRGESANKYQMPDSRSYTYGEYTPDWSSTEGTARTINVTNPITGEEKLFEQFDDGFQSKDGEFISHEYINKAKNVTVPMFDKDQSVASFNVNPGTYDGSTTFTQPKYVQNINTGIDELKTNILAKWVPVDDIIGPVGQRSGEYEVLVMDRNLIPDASYEKITGHSKDAPLSEKWQVANASGKITFPDESSARAAAGEQSVVVHGAQKLNVVTDHVWQDENGYWVQVGDKTPNNVTNEFALELLNGTHSDNVTVIRGKPNPNKVVHSVTGGYSKDLNEVRNLPVPRKVTDGDITTGSGDVVNYDPIIQQGLDNLKTEGDKNLFKHIFGLGDKANIVPETTPPPPITLHPATNPSDTLIQNVLDPLTPTPTALEASKGISGGADMTDTKKLIDSALTTGGINKKFAIQLDSMPPAQRKELADSIINDMSLNGPSADVVRTIIDGYTKAGKSSGFLTHINNVLRGAWATGDASWFGIQGLLTMPKLVLSGHADQAFEVMTTSMRTLAGDRNAFRGFLERKLRDLPEDAPALHAWVDNGLHLSFLQGSPDFSFNLIDDITKGRIAPDAAFMAAGDVMRINEAYNTWQRYKGSGTSLEDISRAINRSTGIAEHPFGGQIGSFALFAPKFFQSQLETILKSVTDGGVEGDIARKGLVSLIGTGVALTTAANYFRGYNDPEMFDPTSPNFMRIRNVAGNDVSVFGPWDSLVKLIVHNGQGDFAYNRTKLSPLATLAYNLMTKSDFKGQPFPPQGSPEHIATEMFKTLALPFAWQDAGKGGFVGGALNVFGVKSSPLSKGERFDANMENLGLDPNDPLARRQFVADHPDQRLLVSKEAQKANEVRTDITGRSQANEADLVNNAESLTDYRENRKILSREMRNKMDMIYQGNDFKSDTQQGRWISGYYGLFDQSQDPVTHDINGPEFDRLQADWIAQNGQGAYDYVLKFLGVGKSDIEQQYLNDMNTLDKLGYFNTPKYDASIYKSGLTDDQIQQYRDRVSAARTVNDDLGKLTYEKAVRQFLGNEVNSTQLDAIINAGSQNFANKQVAVIKAEHPDLFQWFNPKATWSTYQEAKKNGAKAAPTTSGLTGLQGGLFGGLTGGLSGGLGN